MAHADEIALLVGEFRRDMIVTLPKVASDFGLKIDTAELAVADTKAASLTVAPVMSRGADSNGIFLLGYFRSKQSLFRAGYYAIRANAGAEDAEWIDVTGVVKRKTKIWWVRQPPSGNPEKIIINSIEERTLSNGTVTTFVDGTYDKGGLTIHFFFYLY